VKIGYGSNNKTRFLMPDGFLKVNLARWEVEILSVTALFAVPSFKCQGIGDAAHAQQEICSW
jgi:hypothetical protein